MVVDPKHLSPPWRERMPDGQLGPEYGPQTPATYARHVAQHRDWSFQPPKGDRKDAAKVLAYALLEDGSIRVDLPESEALIVREIFMKGHSVRWLARQRGIKRDTIKSYLKRLRAKAGAK